MLNTIQFILAPESPYPTRSFFLSSAMKYSVCKVNEQPHAHIRTSYSSFTWLVATAFGGCLTLPNGGTGHGSVNPYYTLILQGFVLVACKGFILIQAKSIQVTRSEFTNSEMQVPFRRFSLSLSLQLSSIEKRLICCSS